MEGTEENMKRIVVASFVVMVAVAACRSSEEPKTTSAPAPSPSSVGGQYGQTLRGGIDKAKDIQEKMGEQARQLDETAKQNTPNQDE